MSSPITPQQALVRMRRIATGALVIVFCGMIIFRVLESVDPVWGYLRAFCEAATVGALADWFAVVALFRHPLGIPIPHTAILPNNRDRVAASLADFIEHNFLDGGGLDVRVRGVDYATIAANWLTTHRSTVINRLAGALPGWMKAAPTDDTAAWIAGQARRLIGRADIPQFVSAGLASFLADGRSQALYAAVLHSAEEMIIANRPVIQEKIREEIPLPVEALRNLPGIQRFSPALGQVRDQLAAAVASKTIEKVQQLLAEAADVPAHPLRKAFDDKLADFVQDLRSSPAMQVRIAALQQEVTGSAMIDDFAASVWTSLRTMLLADLQDEESELRQSIDRAIQRSAGVLRTDDSLRATVNGFIGEQVLAALGSIRPHIRKHVLSTFALWEPEEIAQKLEETVGRDLQFIRLNGTIIGGFIGVAIHVGFKFAGI